MRFLKITMTTNICFPLSEESKMRAAARSHGMAITTPEMLYCMTSHPLWEEGIAHLFLRADDAYSDIFFGKLLYMLSISAERGFCIHTMFYPFPMYLPSEHSK